MKMGKNFVVVFFTKTQLISFASVKLIDSLHVGSHDHQTKSELFSLIIHSNVSNIYIYTFSQGRAQAEWRYGCTIVDRGG